MSDQSKQPGQEASVPQGRKQQVLASLDTARQAIEELDEQALEAVAGGSFLSVMGGIEKIGKNVIERGIQGVEAVIRHP
jgi:hypothetical protein